MLLSSLTRTHSKLIRDLYSNYTGLLNSLTLHLNKSLWIGAKYIKNIVKIKLLLPLVL